MARLRLPSSAALLVLGASGCVFLVNEEPDGSGGAGAGATSSGETAATASRASSTGPGGSGAGGSGGSDVGGGGAEGLGGAGGAGGSEPGCAAPTAVPTVVSQTRAGVTDLVASGGYVYLRLSANQIDATSYTSTALGSESIAERAVSAPVRITPDDPGVMVAHAGDDESLVVSGTTLAPTVLHAGDVDPGAPAEIVRIPSALRVEGEESRFVLSGGEVYELGVLKAAGAPLDGSMVEAAYNQNVDRLATYVGGLMWTYNGNTLVLCPLAFELGRWGCQGVTQHPIPTTGGTFRRLLHHAASNAVLLLEDGDSVSKVWRVDLGSNDDAAPVPNLDGAADIALVGNHLAASVSTNVHACCLGPGGVGGCASTFFASGARVLHPVAADRFLMANATHLAILRIDP